MKVIAIVGMPGCGKTEALNIIAEQGIPVFNMGDVVTKIEPAKRGITELNEYVESKIRLDIRNEYGPAAVAIMTAEEVEKMNSGTVAIAGLHSFAEVDYFKKRFGQDFIIIAIEASLATRFARSASRKVRPLSKEEFEHREERYAKDFEIPKIMEKADYKIDNEGSVDYFQGNIKRIIKIIMK